MNNNNIFNLAISKIEECKRICIISHVNPDGDSIGSLLGLGIALKRDNEKDIRLALVDDIPNEYKFLPRIDYLQNIDNNDKFDLLITLDCSDLNRLGSCKYVSDNSSYIINIDHHKSNDYFGDINIVDSKASSAGELVFKLLKNMNTDIDKEIATCLYVSISTDTGSFKYDNTSSFTHNVAAELLEKDINKNEITTQIYQNRSLSKTKLFIKSINSMEMYLNNKIGVVIVTQDMLKSCDADIKDVDGIVEFVRDISSVEVACILKELDSNEIKVGLRSKTDIDVAEICEKFRGGGHAKASGCTIFGNVNNAKKQLIEEIIKAFR